MDGDALAHDRVVEFLMQVSGSSNVPFKRLASPMLARLVESTAEQEVDEINTLIQNDRREAIQGDFNLFDEDDYLVEDTSQPARRSEHPGAIATVSPVNRPVTRSQTDANGFMPYEEEEAEEDPAPVTAAAREDGDGEPAMRTPAEVWRAEREARMLESISGVAREALGGRLPRGRGMGLRRATRSDIFSPLMIAATRNAMQKVHQTVRGPLQKAESEFAFIYSNSDDAMALFSQLVAREINRQENLNPRTPRLQATYAWNETHFVGIIDALSQFDYHVGGEGQPIITPFPRVDYDRRGYPSGPYQHSFYADDIVFNA